jgi:SPP1 family phage portal protein
MLNLNNAFLQGINEQILYSINDELSREQLMQSLGKIAMKSVNDTIIKALIVEHSPKRNKMIKMYNEYKGDVDITKRTTSNPDKINNKLANDYRGVIIDQPVAYMYGIPVTAQVDNTKYTDLEYAKNNEQVQDFFLRSHAKKMIKQAGKMAGACGYGAFLAYLDREGKTKFTNINPWECIFIYNQETMEIMVAMRYYTEKDVDLNGNIIERTRVEWYDNEKIMFWVTDDNGTFFPDVNVVDPKLGIGVKQHFFKYIPLIEVPNNEERIGDFEKVAKDIDAYDRLLSDAQNEIESFRNAYMVFKGNITVDQELLDAVRQSGAMAIPADADVTFLTKQINDTAIENQKNTLNENIYKFSNRVDMSDERFSGGTESGESRKWKLLSLENDCINKEVEMENALKNLMKVVCSNWEILGLNLDYLDVFFTFKRNIPIDLSYEADVQQKLKGLVSDKTRLALSRIVDDADYEIETMQDEAMDNVNLDNVQLPNQTDPNQTPIVGGGVNGTK